MQSKIKHFLLFNLIFHLFACTCFFYCETVQAQSDPEIKAKQLFENGQYMEALPVFEDLTRLYPSDPELNYYYGASLIESGQYSPAAQQALTIAGNQKKAYWYLARYFHSNNQWEKAMEAYQKFKDNASAKDLSSVPLDEMIKLCSQQVNPYRQADEESSGETAEDSIQTIEMTTEVPEEVASKEAQPPKVGTDYQDSIISFPVNAQITYLKTDQFTSAKAKDDFLEARQMEQALNRKLEQSKELRDRYEIADDLTKMQLADSILQLERESYKLNQEIARKDQSANLEEAAYWNSAGINEISQFKAIIQHLRDSINAAKQQALLDAMQKEEMIVIEANDSLAMDTLQAETEPVNEIRYKIQIGAYRNTPPDWVQRLFKKLSVLRQIDQYTDDHGVTVYTVGELKSYEDAQQMLKQIKLEGVTNATIAAYKNNERISVDEARKLQQNGS